MEQVNNFNTMKCCPVKFQVDLKSTLQPSVCLSVYPSTSHPPIHPSIYLSPLHYPELVGIGEMDTKTTWVQKNILKLVGRKSREEYFMMCENDMKFEFSVHE